MKKLKINFVVVLVGILFMSFSFNTINAQLSKEEKEDLVFMYEEEKLAFDVYTTLSDKYAIPVFKNISKSEAYHMSMVLDLIKKYDLKDPSGKAKGDFKNKDIQKLYNDLTKKGAKSLIDALEVGATIEDVDIYDLERINSKTKNKDLNKLYKLLICGSENHMRAFTGHLKFRKASYTPQFLSQERFNSIINGKHKRCFELK